MKTDLLQRQRDKDWKKLSKVETDNSLALCPHVFNSQGKAKLKQAPETPQFSRLGGRGPNNQATTFWHPAVLAGR